MKEWWMPIKIREDSELNLNFLCDHLGEAQDIMEEMWKEICRLRPELPVCGFDTEDEDF